MEKLPIAGYVLAGGRSSRMGKDKAMLRLAGRPLIEHSVRKLRKLADEVFILGNDSELASFAPLVPDLHKNCGPLGGIEAALAHTNHDWTLIIPVDVPFLPTALLHCWVRQVLRQTKTRVAFFVVDGTPQPTICLLHREMKTFLAQAVSESRLKLYPAFEAAARALADGNSTSLPEIMLLTHCETSAVRFLLDELEESSEIALAPVLHSDPHLWFSNLNTQEEFAAAEMHLAALADE